MPGSDLILFTPGPVRVSPLVGEFLKNPPCNYHRQEGFSAMLAESEADLKSLIGIRDPAAYYAAQITSTGTGANEGCLYALEPLGKGLLLRNGYFGDRLVDQATQAGIDHIVLDSAGDRPIDPADVEACIQANPDLRWVFFVSHETRMGLVNPMVDIGQVCKRHGLIVGADAISSSYAYPIDIEAAQLDLAVASSAKALGAAPGIGIVFVKLASLATIQQAGKPRSFYLDVLAECQRQRDTSQPRFAQPVALHASIRAACIHLKRVGIDQHFARIQRQMGQLIEHLRKLGIRRLLSPEYSSGIAVNFGLPDGMTYDAFARRMQDEGFFLLYGIPGDQTHFQLSTIGDLHDDHIAGINQAFTKIFAR